MNSGTLMNKNIEYVAYKRHYSDALEYYNQLTVQERIQLLKLFKRMGDSGEIHVKNEILT